MKRYLGMTIKKVYCISEASDPEKELLGFKVELMEGYTFEFSIVLSDGLISNCDHCSVDNGFFGNKIKSIDLEGFNSGEPCCEPHNCVFTILTTNGGELSFSSLIKDDCGEHPSFRVIHTETEHIVESFSEEVKS